MTARFLQRWSGRWVFDFSCLSDANTGVIQGFPCFIKKFQHDRRPYSALFDFQLYKNPHVPNLLTCYRLDKATKF